MEHQHHHYGGGSSSGRSGSAGHNSASHHYGSTASYNSASRHGGSRGYNNGGHYSQYNNNQSSGGQHYSSRRGGTSSRWEIDEEDWRSSRRFQPPERGSSAHSMHTAHTSRSDSYNSTRNNTSSSIDHMNWRQQGTTTTSRFDQGGRFSSWHDDQHVPGSTGTTSGNNSSAGRGACGQHHHQPQYWSHSQRTSSNSSGNSYNNGYSSSSSSGNYERGSRDGFGGSRRQGQRDHQQQHSSTGLSWTSHAGSSSRGNMGSTTRDSSQDYYNVNNNSTLHNNYESSRNKNGNSNANAATSSSNTSYNRRSPFFDGGASTESNRQRGSASSGATTSSSTSRFFGTNHLSAPRGPCAGAATSSSGTTTAANSFDNERCSTTASSNQTSFDTQLQQGATNNPHNSAGPSSTSSANRFDLAAEQHHDQRLYRAMSVDELEVDELENPNQIIAPVVNSNGTNSNTRVILEPNEDYQRRMQDQSYDFEEEYNFGGSEQDQASPDIEIDEEGDSSYDGGQQAVDHNVMNNRRGPPGPLQAALAAASANVAYDLAGPIHGPFIGPSLQQHSSSGGAGASSGASRSGTSVVSGNNINQMNNTSSSSNRLQVIGPLFGPQQRQNIFGTSSATMNNNNSNTTRNNQNNEQSNDSSSNSSRRADSREQPSRARNNSERGTHGTANRPAANSTEEDDQDMGLALPDDRWGPVGSNPFTNPSLVPEFGSGVAMSNAASSRPVGSSREPQQNLFGQMNTGSSSSASSSSSAAGTAAPGVIQSPFQPYQPPNASGHQSPYQRYNSNRNKRHRPSNYHPAYTDQDSSSRAPRMTEESLAAALSSLGGPAYADRTKCDDAIDPISQQRIWDLGDDGKRSANYAEISYLFSYLETDPKTEKEYVRGFAIESFQQLLLQARKSASWPVLRHPVTNIVIPPSAVHASERMIHLLRDAGRIAPIQDEDPTTWALEDIMSHADPAGCLKKLAFSVFQPFYIKASIELDEANVLDLPLKDLKLLAKELKGMYLRNFDVGQRKQLCPETNGQAFLDTPYWENDERPWLFYILSNIHYVTGYNASVPEYLRKMAMYVLVAALAVVCPQVRERYSDSFSLDFDYAGGDVVMS